MVDGQASLVIIESVTPLGLRAVPSRTVPHRLIDDCQDGDNRDDLDECVVPDSVPVEVLTALLRLAEHLLDEHEHLPPQMD
jgi:hypothetical protein